MTACRMPPWAALLIALGAGLLLGAPQARAATVPEPVAASRTAADRSPAGDAVCTKCHDQSEAKPVLSIAKTPHGVKADARTPGCQSCHGASLDHVKNEKDLDPRPATDIGFGAKSATPPEQQVKACIGCHQGGQRGHWEGSQHQAANVPCSSCHTSHAPRDKMMQRTQQPEACFACHKSERAQLHRISTHPVAAGKMACSDCHNPHGSTGPSLMRKGSVNDTCTTCHAEKRGPMLWEHQPVTESCVTCHTPHGSNSSPLLKLRSPMLCQSCHSGDHAAQVNSGANLQGGAVTTARGNLPLASAPGRAQIAGKACQSCHIQTHGSNHPGGSKLLR